MGARTAIVIVVASSSVAFAQPVPTSPPGAPVPEPSAPGPAPDPTRSPTPPPASDPNAPPPASDPNAPPPEGDPNAPQPASDSTQPAQHSGVMQPMGPLDFEGWPRGYTVEDLRALPECGPEGLPDTPGATITCRPILDVASPMWGMGFDWTTGATFGSVPTTGGAHGFGVEVDFGLTRWFQVGTRYELLGIAVPSSPTEGVHAALSHHLLAHMRFRLWSDEVKRNGWALGLGAGYALRGDALGGHAPLVRVSLAREIGRYLRVTAPTAAVEVAYEHSRIGDAELRAVLASLRFGFETNLIPPPSLGQPAPPPGRRTTTVDMLLSAWSGLGVSTRWAFGCCFMIRAVGDYLTNVTRAHPIFRAYEGAQWSARLGPRLRARNGVFVDAHAGVSWYAHDPEGELRPVWQGELGIGARIAEISAWLRGDLERGGLDSGGLRVTLVFGAKNGWISEKTSLTLWTPRMSLPDIPNVSVGGNVDVDVNVKVEPVVIEVPLGARVFGIGVHIDPRLLPIDRLRNAGFVKVELTGPAGALSSFQAELTGTLDSRGVRVDAWSTVATSASIVRARFTIYPPGTRP